MFRQAFDHNADSVTIYIDEQSFETPAGISVAAAILLHGTVPSRTTALSSAPRAPFCMMGVCFDCVMEINGIANQRTCQIIVQEGMRIHKQTGAGSSL